MNTTQNFDDDLLFSDDEPDSVDLVEDVKAPWKVMIVDDEPSVHDVTQLSLIINGIELSSAQRRRRYSRRGPH